jgi:UDP:flavonoid glycosyltransferase YjiC (YdhE family)
MSRFLFTTMPATGHVMPKLPIARELVARGHDVHWYTGAAYRASVRATGATHHPIRSAEDFGGQTIGEAFPELVGLTGVTMVRRAFQRVFIDNAEGMLRDCQAILAEHPADVILAEPLFVAARWLHELGGPPWATLGESMLGTYSRDTAPFGPGLFPLGGPAGRLRNATMNLVHRRLLFAPVTSHYEQARARVGLPRLGVSFIDTFIGSHLYMQSTVPGFEYPRSDLPPQVHFIGPLLPEPTANFDPPRWWDELGGSRPVVLVTQGTVATDPQHLLVPTLRALADEDALVIATTGGPAEDVLNALGGTPPAHVKVERFVPYAELMPHIRVLVTNGGYGTVQHALSEGVPIVVAGATEDKPEVAARIAWSGAGIRLRSQSPAPEHLRRAVREVLDRPDYRNRAHAIGEEMAAYDAPRTAATLLENLAGARRRTPEPSQLSARPARAAR